jgi:hypothetical protein
MSSSLTLRLVVGRLRQKPLLPPYGDVNASYWDVTLPKSNLGIDLGNDTFGMFLLSSNVFICLLDSSIRQCQYHEGFSGNAQQKYYGIHFSCGRFDTFSHRSTWLPRIRCYVHARLQCLWTYPPSQHSNSPPETSLRFSCALPMSLFRPVKFGPLGMVTLH